MHEIFVFGSNLAGLHGGGSAREAYEKHGAAHGAGGGVGLQGNSYAIPTKDKNIETLPLESIEPYVKRFLDFARQHPEWRFNIVAIGCGLAGYKFQQIAPMFEGAPQNCHFINDWNRKASS